MEPECSLPCSQGLAEWGYIFYSKTNIETSALDECERSALHHGIHYDMRPMYTRLFVYICVYVHIHII
jgi:hypothetical protein